MKRLFGLTLVFTAGLSIATAGAAEPERVRGTVVAVSANVLTAHTATGGDVSILLRGDTTYLTEARSDLNHIPAGSYIGVAASVTAETARRGAKQLKVTYKGGEQTILVPPTAPIVNLQPGAVSDLKPGDIVFVNAIADGGKTTAKLILVGSDGVAPAI
jgi:hypothetical protein